MINLRFYKKNSQRKNYSKFSKLLKIHQKTFESRLNPLETCIGVFLMSYALIFKKDQNIRYFQHVDLTQKVEIY